MVGKLLEKYIGRKFLIFLIATLAFLFLDKMEDMHWLLAASIYMAANIVSKLGGVDIKPTEDISKTALFISKYLGRKFIVVVTGTLLFWLNAKFKVDTWLILIGVYSGAAVTVDFIPNIKSAFKISRADEPDKKETTV